MRSAARSIRSSPTTPLARLRGAYHGTVCVHTVQTGSDPDGAAFLRQLAGTTPDCGSFRQIDQVTTVASLHKLERDVFLGPATPDVAAAPGDLDGDGVIDARDACPGTPRGATVDARGCWHVKGLHFAHDSAAIDPQGEQALDEVANVLRKNPNLHVQIGGHTDAVGSDEYNRALSDRRAEAARKYLASTGIDESRLDVEGLRQEQPGRRQQHGRGPGAEPAHGDRSPRLTPDCERRSTGSAPLASTTEVPR